MELYKFISETEIQRYKGGFVVLNNRIYTNPTEETVRAAGYKELIDAPMLEYNPETEYIDTTYIENGSFISAIHTIKQFEVTPDE